ncbi:MAG TPA: hypothetical protein VHS07_06765 [Candidatus Binataceae bacterium]|jgi:hypothetical protein|nr:hypothetical protein [Candidatus Binataceae bacterium]
MTIKGSFAISTSLLGAMALAALSLSSTALAQSAPVNTVYGQHHPNVEGFDNYLDQHPDVRQQLSRNPHLIDNPEYLANHPELRDYMHEHPRAATAFRRHPDRFMHREHVYNRSERRWDRRHGQPVDNH